MTSKLFPTLSITRALSTSIVTLALWAVVGVHGAMAVTACPAGMDGEGNENAPCEIATWAQLQAIGADSNTRELHYKLMNDLTAGMGADYDDNAGPGANGGEGWKPISSFRGQLDGNNKVIEDLTINNSGNQSAGLFAEIALLSDGAAVIIKDLTLRRAFVESTAASSNSRGTGGLVGRVTGIRDGEATLLIKNVVIDSANIVGNTHVGGLIGLVGSESSSLSAETATFTPQLTIEDTAVVATEVKGTSGVGGVIASVYSSRNVSLARVLADVSLTVDTSGVGALIGRSRVSQSAEVSVTDSFGVGSINREPPNTNATGRHGGLIGRFTASSDSNASLAFSNSYAAVEIVADGFYTNNTVGGLVGFAFGPDISFDSTYYDLVRTNFKRGEASQGPSFDFTGTDLTSDQLLDVTSFVGWDFTENGPWLPPTANSYPVLRVHVDLLDQVSPPVCPNEMSGRGTPDSPCLVTDWDDMRAMGDLVFAHYQLQNDLDASADTSTNGNAATDWTPIRFFGGVFDGNGKTVSGLKISAVDNSGTGFIADLGLRGEVRNLFFDNVEIANVAATRNRGVGTIAGISRGSIEDVYVVTKIHATDSTSDSALNHGGLVGVLRGDGKISRSAVDLDYSISNRTSASLNVGGLVGNQRDDSSIANSYAVGKIAGVRQRMGGLVGQAQGNSSIINSYSRIQFVGTGSVDSRNGLVGGVINNPGITSSYWDEEVATSANVVLGTANAAQARSTVEMKTQSTFSGWDFSEVWGILNEAIDAEQTRVSYPFLRPISTSGWIVTSGENSDIGETIVNKPLELAETNAFSPAADSTDVSPANTLSVTFAEPISTSLGSGNITVSRAGGSSSTVSNSNTVVSGNTLTLNTGILDFDATYTITIPAGKVSAEANADRKNLTISWSFETASGTAENGGDCPAGMVDLNFGDAEASTLCEITSWLQLASIDTSIDTLGLSYRLANDLGPDDPGYEVLVVNPSKGWAPIGSISAPFHGVFDGNQKTISGLAINRTGNNDRNTGLFARLARAVVHDLVLEDVDIRGRGRTGALAGIADFALGTRLGRGEPTVGSLPSGNEGQDELRIERVFVSGSLVHDGQASWLGGLVGILLANTDAENTPVSVRESGFVGTIGRTGSSGNNQARYTGGLIGKVLRDGSSGTGEFSLQSVYVIGEIVGRREMGGLIGTVGENTAVSISDGYVSADLTLWSDSPELAGALVGGTIDPEANRGAVTLDGEVYWRDEGTWFVDATSSQKPTPQETQAFGEDVTVVNSENAIALAEEDLFIGTAAEDNLSALFATEDVVWSVVTPDTEGSFLDLAPILANVPSQPQIDAQTPPRQCPEGVDGGWGLPSVPCELTSWSDLSAVREEPSSAYILLNNLSPSTPGYTLNFTPLPPFTGIFDGNNKTIDGLRVQTTSANTGLFSALQGTVKNLTLSNVDIKGGDNTGALAGRMGSGLVEDVHVSGRVDGGGNTGGLIGNVAITSNIENSIIRGSSTAGVVSGGNSTGGLIGNGAGTVQRSFSTSDVSSLATSLGGLFGRVGQGGVHLIEDSYFAGTITKPNESDVGGIAGSVQGNTFAPPGETTGTATFNRVFSSGVINGGGAGLIGLISIAADVEVNDSYTVMTINDSQRTSNTAEASGLVGSVRSSGSSLTINRSFAALDVDEAVAADERAGLVRSGASGTTIIINDSFWDTEALGTEIAILEDDENAANEGGLTAADMKGASAATAMAALDFGDDGAWLTVVTGNPEGAFQDGYPILELPVPTPVQLSAQNVGLSAIGITSTGPALALFFAVLDNADPAIALTEANKSSLTTIATAADIVMGVASGELPRTALTVATFEALGITGVTNDNIGAARSAVAAVINLNEIATVAGLQAVVTNGIASAAAAQPIFDNFVDPEEGMTPAAPTPQDYEGIGVLGVTPGNVSAINDILINTEVASDDTGGIQHLVDAYNSLIASLEGETDPTLVAVDYAAMGLGEVVTDDNIAELLNNLIGREDADTVKGWAETDPVSTYSELKALAEFAAKIVNSAVSDPTTPADLEADDLAALGLDAIISTDAEIDLFNEVIAGLRPDQVSSLEKLENIAVAVETISDDFAEAELADFTAIGLPVTADSIGLFKSVLADEDPPIGYATMLQAANAAGSVIAVAEGGVGPVPLTAELLESIGVDLENLGDNFPEVFLAIRDAGKNDIPDLDALQELVNEAIREANTYTLTVVGGGPSGEYLAGERVTIRPDIAPEGQRFAQWLIEGFTGPDGDDITAAEAVITVSMPAFDWTATAQFEDEPPPEFRVNLLDLRGFPENPVYFFRDVPAGSEITISAPLPDENQVFTRWRLQGDGSAQSFLANVNSPVTTLAMPSQAVTLVAEFENVEPETYSLSVGSGAGSGEYEQGERVNIAANPAPEGKRFSRWRGDTASLANTSDPNTYLVMPAEPVTVVAGYVDLPPEELPQTLTITNGEGSGTYMPGSSVTISAAVPGDDELFDRWLGDVTYVTNVDDATTTVVMPAQAVSLRASYREAPPEEFVLTVEGGTGDGEYEAGDVITIAADLAPEGKVFDKWIGQTARVANVNQPTTTVTMPDSAVSVRAVYKDLPPQTFALTVEGGTGSGDYTQGRVVAIAADPAEEGKVFERWEGQTAAVANVNQPNTTLTMPGTAVTVRARYADAPAEEADSPTLRTGGRGGGRGSIPGDGFLMNQATAKRDWSAESGMVMRGQSVGRQVDAELIEQQVPAGTLVFIEAPPAPEDFYFDKWIGQTAFVDNIHQPRTSVLMPNHDVTVLAQYRSFDGTTTVTLAPNQVSGTAQTLPAGNAGDVVALEAAPTVTIDGTEFIFDFWEGQTATVANVLLPETTVRLSNTDVVLRPVYRAKPAGTVTVTAPAGTAIPADIAPGSYIDLSAPTPPEGLAFERWTGQTGTVETPDQADSRLYVGANAITLTAQFIQAADPAAVEELVEGTAPPADVDVYTDAGASDAVEANLSAYNDALAVLRAVATNDAPLTIEAVREMVTTYNTILSAAAGNTAPSLDASGYAKVGVTVPAGAVALLNNGVASAAPTAVDTVAKLQAIADAAAALAAFAAGDEDAAAPQAADYTATGFDITEANVSSYNSALAKTEASTVVAIEALIAAYDKLIAGTALTSEEFTAIGVSFTEDGPDNTLALVNDAAKQTNTDIATVAAVQAIVDAAERILTVAAGDEVDPALSADDFSTIGIVGVTATNLADVIVELGKADANDLTTIAALTAALGDLSDPEKVAELVAFDGTGDAPGAAVYEAAGVGGVAEDNLNAYASALAAVELDEGDVAGIQALVDTYNAILSAAAGNTAPNLDESDYAKVGVTVPAGAVALLNNGVASADADAVDTVAELQAIADAADRISTLASAGTGTPTAADYSAVGLADVIAANASAYNSAVAEVKPATPAGIQAVITAYNSVLAAAGNVATAADLTAAVYSELGVTVPATALGLLNSAVGSQGAAASNTVAKLQAMSAAAAKVINTAANSQDAGLTESDFTVLGVQGVTPANVADASAAVADAEVAEVDTVPKLQALLTEVLTPPLPVPTLSLWSLLLMVMLMMGLGLRQRALRSKF